MGPIDRQVSPASGGPVSRPQVMHRAGQTPLRRRWLRRLVHAALLLACMPVFAVGWVKLLSQTAAEKFDDEDIRMFLETARDTLNADGPPKTFEWSNAKNQTGGSFIVVGDSVRNGLPCRRIKFSTYAPGYPNPPKSTTTWTACKIADGRWKLAEAR